MNIHTWRLSRDKHGWGKVRPWTGWWNPSLTMTNTNTPTQTTPLCAYFLCNVWLFMQKKNSYRFIENLPFEKTSGCLPPDLKCLAYHLSHIDSVDNSVSCKYVHWPQQLSSSTSWCITKGSIVRQTLEVTGQTCCPSRGPIWVARQSQV